MVDMARQVYIVILIIEKVQDSWNYNAANPKGARV